MSLLPQHGGAKPVARSAWDQLDGFLIGGPWEVRWMKLMALLLLAAPPDPKPPGPLLPGAAGFDLARVGRQGRCGEGDDDAIVVCGHSKSDEIVIPDAARFAGKPLRAEVKLPGGATGDVHAEQHVMPDGRSAPAVMVTVKVPF